MQSFVHYLTLAECSEKSCTLPWRRPALGQAEKTEINWLAALFALTHKSGTLNLSGHIICEVYALMQVQSLHNTFRSSIMHSDRDATRPPSVFTYSQLNDSQVCIAFSLSKPPAVNLLPISRELNNSNKSNFSA